MPGFSIDVTPYLPAIPFLKMKLHSPQNIGGKLVDVHAFIDKVVSDGKLDAADIPTAVAIWFSAPASPKPEPPVVVLPPTPAQPAPTPAPRPSQPSQAPASSSGITSWVEEMWNDMFRGEVAPDSDWLPGGSPRFNAILGGFQVAPSGTRVRFMAEELPAGSHKMGAYVIEHVLNYGGATYSVRSDSTEDDQPGGDEFHVVRGPRYRAGMGWDVTIQFRAFDGTDPRTVTYFARSVEDPGIAGVPQSFKLAHK